MNLVKFGKVLSAALIVGSFATGSASAQDGKLIHDAEHNILLSQHSERWAKEDAVITAKLAEIRKNHGGKP